MIDAIRTPTRGVTLGLSALALGYFLLYAPYAGLTKALTSGLLPGSDGPVSGFVILPATVVASIVTMALVLMVTGWWRMMDTREVLGIPIPIPRSCPSTPSCASARTSSRTR